MSEYFRATRFMNANMQQMRVFLDAAIPGNNITPEKAPAFAEYIGELYYTTARDYGFESPVDAMREACAVVERMLTHKQLLKCLKKAGFR